MGECHYRVFRVFISSPMKINVIIDETKSEVGPAIHTPFKLKKVRKYKCNWYKEYNLS